MNIHQLVQLVLSSVSTIFVVSMVIAKLVGYIKLKLIDRKDKRDKLIEKKEKELFIELSKKYGSKVIADLQEVKKNEK